MGGAQGMLGQAASRAKSLEISHADICVLCTEMLNSITGCRHYLQFRALVEPTWVSADPSVHPGSLKIANAVDEAICVR